MKIGTGRIHCGTCMVQYRERSIGAVGPLVGVGGESLVTSPVTVMQGKGLLLVCYYCAQCRQPPSHNQRASNSLFNFLDYISRSISKSKS